MIIYFSKKKTFVLFFLLCSSCFTPSIYSQEDLEEYVQDFFIETMQIIIPGYSHAFNPSIVKWKNGWLMSFRMIISHDQISEVCSATESSIYLVYLNEELIPIGIPQLLSLDHAEKKRPFLLAEDARLIVDEERLFIVYSANKEAQIEDKGFRVYAAEVEENIDGFSVTHNECLSHFEGMDIYKREKNWTPFIHENKLLLAYTLNPHLIFRPFLDGSEECETVAKTCPSSIWEWGDMRGGTPAIQLNDDYYLGFFHSVICLNSIHSNNIPILHYFMGAYLFSTNPPFEIKYISPEPLIGKNFYHGIIYEPYWHPVRVVFPCGLIIQNDEIWISYGRQDHEMWIAKLNKEKLLADLIHISTLKN